MQLILFYKISRKWIMFSSWLLLETVCWLLSNNSSYRLVLELHAELMALSSFTSVCLLVDHTNIHCAICIVRSESTQLHYDFRLPGNFILILVIHEYFSPISFRNLILLPLRTEFRELNKLDPFWFDMCRWKTFQGSEWKYYYISFQW